MAASLGRRHLILFSLVFGGHRPDAPPEFMATMPTDGACSGSALWGLNRIDLEDPSKLLLGGTFHIGLTQLDPHTGAARRYSIADRLHVGGNPIMRNDV